MAEMFDQNQRDLKNQQLLSAYIDGELGMTERALAEKLIRDRDEPRYAKLAEFWRENGINMRALPKYHLDEGFSDRVLEKIYPEPDAGFDTDFPS